MTMRPPRILLQEILASAFVLVHGAYAERGILEVYVADPQGRPIKGVELDDKGPGHSLSPSDAYGKTRIQLTPGTQPGDWIDLQIARVLDGHDLVLISPWNGKVIVPAFENESDNYVQVVLTKRGDRTALESGEVVKTLVAIILAESRPQIDELDTRKERRIILAEISQEYGLEPDHVDQAIRKWMEKAKDPYEKGLADFYAENFPAATEKLSESFQIRRNEMEKAKAEMVDAAFFLGSSLFREEKYKQSVEVFHDAFVLRPDDIKIMDWYAVSLRQVGYNFDAEPLFRRKLAIDEKQLGLEHPDTKAVRETLENLQKQMH